MPGKQGAEAVLNERIAGRWCEASYERARTPSSSNRGVRAVERTEGVGWPVGWLLSSRWSFSANFSLLFLESLRYDPSGIVALGAYHLPT